MKDVSIRIRGEDRKDLLEISRLWPVPHVDIVGAALRNFRELPPEKQAAIFQNGRKPRRRTATA